ncbi:hypothetical protein [Enterobacter asburiae]|uniref:hypothetical protein n=1 Tax=Enterobacter asburiae TaxID=61645 RepID=UPI0020034D0D|nr:hypothetical protein [Enterobacter asburiae]MCK7419634.1 hypothetical protein [Enterobacter asburiae]HCM9496918.1 hypothetical protein [Enterobacter asburiae]
MDIIQLLEVLKPAKDVVTVQIASQKDQLAPWIDLAKAVLPAAATAGIVKLKYSAENSSHKNPATIGGILLCLSLPAQPD